MVMSAQKCVPVKSELGPEPNLPSEDEGDDSDEIPELQECSDKKIEGVCEEYERNKAMVDTDRDVSRLFLPFVKIATYHV
jgi:hypothetical protein